MANRRLQVITDQLNSDLQYITASRNAAEAAKRMPGAPWTNLAQLGMCKPSRHETPQRVEDVQRLIKEAIAKKHTIRIAGMGRSPNDITYTSDVLVHTEGFSRILSVDTKAQTITCEGGAVLGEVHRVLDANGLMLRCIPSIVDMTVGGSLATATHSSGIGVRSLCGYVTEMIFVNGRGDVVSLNRREHERNLRLAACHLGALGFVVQVTLQAERKSMWHLSSACLTTERLHKVLAQRVMTAEYYRFWWTPHTNYCYETIGTRMSSSDEEGRGDTQSTAGMSTASGTTAQSDISTAQSEAFGKRVRNVLALMRKATTGESDLRTWSESQKTVFAKVEALVKGNWLKHHTLEAALFMSCFAPCMQPAINQAYQKIFLNNSVEFYGSAVDAFTFDCLFKQWACEWAIEAHRALEAFDLIRQMIHQHRLKVHFPIEFRFADEEDVAMSPSVGRKTCWIGMVMYRPHLKEARDTIKAYNLFCELMQRLGGRPHWAKYFQWRLVDVQQSYGMHAQKWLEYRRDQDPHGVFVNDFMRRLTSQQ